MCCAKLFNFATNSAVYNDIFENFILNKCIEYSVIVINSII